MESSFVPAPSSQIGASKQAAATTARIVLAFLSVYIFWGSTYTAIRIGVAQMPAFLLAGTRFLTAGALLLIWCRWRGLRLIWPAKDMLLLCLIGLLLLGGGNVGLVYAEETVPSGLASLVLAVIPLYVALIEMFLPGGEPLPARGWLGMALGFAGLVALVWPSLRSGLAGDRAQLWAVTALLAGALCWAAGSVVSRRSRLSVNSFVAASWQMLAAGACSTLAGTFLGQWPRFHVNAPALWSQAYLVICGSLLGYSGYIYLLEHVPVGKVASYAYVNPVVAVLLGIVLLGERPAPEEFAGMAAVVVAVFLLTTAQIKSKHAAIQTAQLEKIGME
ncbi:MAG: EamA family transporter [Terracidiphilus sp.]|jgi:drug/metabolite transporter (DMT)-like permease